MSRDVTPPPTAPLSEPSITRIAEASNASQYVTLRSVPVVRYCDSSGW